MDDGRLVMIDWQGRRRIRRDVIAELHDAGRSVAEIARDLDIRYQIVHQQVTRITPAPSVQPPSRRPPIAPTAVDDGEPSDAILVGCVKTKGPDPLPAKDLYRSELWRRRRAYAEASGVPWWVLSAEYGLVDPEAVIAPYDTVMGSLALGRRHVIGKAVAADLEAALGDLSGKRIEIHAGNEYVETVAPFLRARGAIVRRPLLGIAFGPSLAWYGQRLGLAAGSGRSQTSVGSPSQISPGNGRGLGRRVSDRFMNGSLDLSARAGAPKAGWHGMPEIIAAKRLRASGADDRTVRLFLTFCAAMDRARDADRLAVAATRLFEAQPWTFDPRSITRRSVRDLADALRTSGVSQRHSVDAYAWRLLAETLADPALAPATHAAMAQATPMHRNWWTSSRRQHQPERRYSRSWVDPRSPTCGSGCLPIRETRSSPTLASFRSPLTCRSVR